MTAQVTEVRRGSAHANKIKGSEMSLWAKLERISENGQEFVPAHFPVGVSDYALLTFLRVDDHGAEWVQEVVKFTIVGHGDPKHGENYAIISYDDGSSSDTRRQVVLAYDELWECIDAA